MHDPWTEKLSEYIDGDLPPVEARGLDQHLESCDVCRATLAELRDVVRAGASLEDAYPANDLWQGIAARIATNQTIATAGTQPRAATRRFSFSGAQLAIAATVLMAVSGMTAWLIAARTSSDAPTVAMGTIVQTSGTATQLTSTPVAADPAISKSVAELERTLDESRAQLDAATIEVVERSIDAIDRAIADARAALESDPGNPFLSRQLDNTLRKKIDILERATGTRRAGT